MLRTACIDVVSFPLQLLLRRHPDWHDRPAAVVSEDKPLGIVVSVNPPAHAAGVRTGMCYAAALSLVAHLQANTVGPGEVAAGVELILDRLLSISPFVEGAGANTESHAACAEPGVFWLDVSGLQRHHSSPATLARTIRCLLGELRFDTKIVIGYTRFGTRLLAPDARHGWLVVGNAAAERVAALRSPLDRLPLETQARDLLEKLDITTVDAFLQLPYAEVLWRLGSKAAAMHRLVCSDLELPVQGDIPASPFLYRTRLSYTETDARRLQRHVEGLLDALLDRLRKEDLVVEELRLRLLLEDGSHRHEPIRPAAPTYERRLLVDLIALRLQSLDLSAGVDELAVDAAYVPAHTNQMTLFRTLKRRDPAAGAEALARIRAQFGNHSVVHAVLEDENLPEAQFRWQPVAEVVLPQPDVGRPQENKPVNWLVRRVLRRPTEHPPSGSAVQGPCLISGGWWHVHNAKLTRGVDRAYYISLSPNGTLEWVYYDRLTGRWYLQGWVE